MNHRRKLLVAIGASVLTAPLSGLTQEAASAPLTRKISNWKALGGPEAPIEVVTRTPAAREVILDYGFVPYRN